MLCMSLLMSISLVACSTTEEGGEDRVKIGIIQLVDHTSLNIINDSIYAQLESEGYGPDDVDILYQNANGDESLLPTIVEQMKSDEVDVIIAITTPVAQATTKVAQDIPVIFAAVSDPIAAKLVEDLDKPSFNITGTSDEVQVDLLLDLATQLYADTETIGYIYNAGEANSFAILGQVEAYAEENGYALESISVTNANEIQTAMETLVTKSDIIFSPTDNTVATAMAQVSEIANEAKIPFFAGADSMVMDGAFLAYGINYENLGKETADMAIEVINGTLVEDIPVKVYRDDLNVYINESTADAIGFTQLELLQENYNVIVIE